MDFDCHAHVYEQITAVPGARYVPSVPAHLSDWLKSHEKHGLKGGVIVQVSFLGTDNSELCAALTKLDHKRFAGVAVVPLEVSEEALDALVKAGVCGIRWNLVGGASIPDLETKSVQQFLNRLSKRNMHLEVHLEAAKLNADLAHLTDCGVNVVLDHFGLPSNPAPSEDPLIQAIGNIADTSSLYFKFSAPYRTQFDLRPHAREILNCVGDKNIVWGSDWPHTQHEHVTDFDILCEQRHQWGIPSDHAAVKALYGLEL